MMIQSILGSLWRGKLAIALNIPVARRFSLIALALALLLSLISSGVRAQETDKNPDTPQEIPFITYHIGEPFVVSAKAKLGLTYELAKILSARSDGRYNFVVKLMPRARINEKITRMSEQTVIPWVNPAWFDDAAQTKYLWTEGYLEDSNSIVSSINSPVEYTGPASLKGLRVAGLEGTKWVGLEPLIEQGSITRVTTTDYWLSVRLVYFEKVDAALLPAPIAKYLLAKRKLAGRIHFSAEPHSRYWRHMMIKGDRDIQSYLQSQIAFLRQSREWKSIMARYGQ